MTKLFLIAAALLSAASTPVFAEEGRTGAAATQSEAPSTRAVLVSSTQRYCVREVETGSPFVYRACKTRQKWLREGFDPIAKH